ncbi:hypothetical protein IMZ29_09070 [Achromobacter sp. GG226]|uniref:hypothetical protein n=1 Tax=Verticiella alkaliphila TaxID=2779529 RepID=UPI001C0D0B16|nr:hypothetical protein [Verticiella sp. GG226]MBU4610680.1 hypothetical protein [Verticiella sp. GG226]
MALTPTVARGCGLLALATGSIFMSGCGDDHAARHHHMHAAAIHSIGDGQGQFDQTPECLAATSSDDDETGLRTLQMQTGRIVFVTRQAEALTAGQGDTPVSAITLFPGGDALQHGSTTYLPATGGQSVGGSALFTPTTIVSRRWEARPGAAHLTLITQTAHAAHPEVGGAIVRRHRLGPAEYTVVFYPRTSRGDPQGVLANLVALEVLFAQVLTLETHARFRWVIAKAGHADGTDAQALAYPIVLRKIALARQCAAAAVSRATLAEPIPWQVARIDSPSVPTAAMDDSVSALLIGPEGPLAQRQLLFSRLPHLACSAKTDDLGQAACELADTLGHPTHPGFESAPNVVTFPGEVGADLIVLPTALPVRR